MNNQRHNSSYWENVALTKWGSYISEIEREAILKADSSIAEKAVLLDVGCDGGRWSKFLSNMGWTDIICTDVAPLTLNICHKRMPHSLCVLTDPRSSVIPCKAETISLLLCIEVPEVINHILFTAEAFRVLRPGGVLLGTLLNKFSYRPMLHQLWPIRTSKKLYYEISYNKLRKDLFQTGFNIIYEKGFCWAPFSRSSNSRLIPYFTEAERYFGLNNFPAISPWVVFIAQKV